MIAAITQSLRPLNPVFSHREIVFVLTEISLKGGVTLDSVSCNLHHNFTARKIAQSNKPYIRRFSHFFFAASDAKSETRFYDSGQLTLHRF